MLVFIFKPMKTSKNHIPYISLPSFLRRVLKSSALKKLILEQGCELNRIGRSRHWQLRASFEQLEATISAIEANEEPSWQWLVAHLSKQRRDIDFDNLISIAEKKPGITLSELMLSTDCTIVQARKVIDTIEFGD